MYLPLECFSPVVVWHDRLCLALLAVFVFHMKKKYIYLGFVCAILHYKCWFKPYNWFPVKKCIALAWLGGAKLILRSVYVPPPLRGRFWRVSIPSGHFFPYLVLPIVKELALKFALNKVHHLSTLSANRCNFSDRYSVNRAQNWLYSNTGVRTVGVAFDPPSPPWGSNLYRTQD